LGFGLERHDHGAAVRGASLLLHINDIGDLPHALAAEIGFAGVDAIKRVIGKARGRAGRGQIGATPTTAAASNTAAGTAFGSRGRFLSQGQRREGERAEGAKITISHYKTSRN